jgi:transcriptional regulator with XRE-family HTH domain
MQTIRELREKHGWTQLDLANKVGVTPSTIYNWESGRFEPRASQLRDLAQALGVRMDDIKLGSTDEESKKLVA